MSRSRKMLLILCVNMLILGLATFGLEFKLAHDRRKAEAKWSKQVRPYYWPSLQTRDGIALGTRSGPLKLVLHPFVVYANLPNQKTPHFSINNLGFRGGDIRKAEKTKSALLWSEAPRHLAPVFSMTTKPLHNASNLCWVPK